MLTYESCALCPRKCGVNRHAGEMGFCKMPAGIRAAHAMVHDGEEPVISGSFGSGAVFFSGCTLGCVFCQNEPISHGGLGTEISSARLRGIFEALIEEGVQNINLVTPTHFLPDILPALTPKLPVPVVYNCGGYESIDTLRQLEGLVDIYLPDFKYSDRALAKRLSLAENYPEVARAALLEMFRQTGPTETTDGILTRGVVVRHLMLPGQIENTLGVLDLIAELFPKDAVLLSLMCQYVPTNAVKTMPPLNRRVTEDEYAAACSWASLLGLQNGYLQNFSAATMEYLPDFSLAGIL